MFNDESVTQCYINCLLESLNMIRKGKIHTDLAMRQANLFLPESIKADWMHGLDVCRNHGKANRLILLFYSFPMEFLTNFFAYFINRIGHR